MDLNTIQTMTFQEEKQTWRRPCDPGGGTRAVASQAKGRQPHHELEESHEMHFPGSLQGDGPADTLISDFRCPELRENQGLLFQAPWLVALCDSTSGKLIRNRDSAAVI